MKNRKSTAIDLRSSKKENLLYHQYSGEMAEKQHPVFPHIADSLKGEVYHEVFSG